MECQLVDHAIELRRRAFAALKQVKEGYLAEFPEAADFRLFAEVGAYKRRPKEMKDVMLRAVSIFVLDRRTVRQSNKEIVARLQENAPKGYRLPATVLTYRFAAWEQKRAQQMLLENGLAINLAKNNTPSKLKRALAALYAGQEATETVSARISFSDTAVIVGERRYPIHAENGVPRIQVNKRKLNVSALQDLLAP